MKEKNIEAEDNTPFGRHLFTFAVVADSHINEAEDTCVSPYETNRKANARFRYVVDRIEQQKPDFVLHLGDIVHPVPGQPTYSLAVAEFRKQIANSALPWHLVPGNHDIGDKPLPWAPADTTTDNFLTIWEKHFGAHYYHFDHKFCRFIVLNASIINSGLDAEKAQASWLEDLLSNSDGYRIVLSIHYPPYLNQSNEHEHYDNIAEPGRSWLLNLLEKYKIEILLAGHVHNFWYYRHDQTDCYLLPATSFIRHDYSEMYRVEPAPERGRDDREKLGYFMISVHERGMICHMNRTDGQMRSPDDDVLPLQEMSPSIHSAENTRAPLGIELKSAWAEETEIPSSGSIDEFVRKKARNDYPLLALWEMGVRRHLIPLQDLDDERLRERIRIMRRMNHHFTLQSFAMPDPAGLAVVMANADLVDGWVLTVAPHDVEGGLNVIDHIMAKTSVPIYLSRMLDKNDITTSGDKYYHVIAHGFTPENSDIIEDWRKRLKRPIAGAVYRIVGEDDPVEVIRSASLSAKALGLHALMHMRQSYNFNAAFVSDDERHSANRISAALFAAMAETDLTVYLDTFADVDRGYFPRVGVVDRRFNPKPASRMIRHLYAAMNANEVDLTPCAVETDSEGMGIHACHGDGVGFILLLPKADCTISAIDCSILSSETSDNIRIIDLDSGVTMPLDRTPDTSIIRFAEPLHCNGATLIAMDIL